ncbi:MAG: phosphatase PAP2 family protein [Gemmataceae bacterium]|nr:phosphatase PAP2 family protein [Gemmataceae bacterium]
MKRFAPNTNWDDARRFRAAVLTIISLLLAFAFGLTAAGVDDRRLFVEWDGWIKEHWPEHARQHPTLLTLALGVTHLGDSEVLIALSVLVGVILIGRRERRLAAVWLATTLGGLKLVDVLKIVYDRPRPEFLEPLILEPTKSFPSGHAAGTTLACGMLAYLLIRATYRAGWFVLPLLSVLPVLVGLTRIYLGAHWLSDVVGGWLVGGSCVAGGMALAEILRNH